MAIITDIFIFILLTNTSQLVARDQTGSMPIGYMQSGSVGLIYLLILLCDKSQLSRGQGTGQQEPNKLSPSPRKSLYIHPQQKAKKPIMRIMQRRVENSFKELFFTASLLKTNNKPTIKRISPCPMSPNMTPKNNGKVTVVKMLGLIY